MRRREFITLVGGAAVDWPLAVRAQPENGCGGLAADKFVATNPRAQSHIAAFSEELCQLGWVEAQKIRIDIRWSGGDVQLARVYAAQLIGLNLT